MIVFKASLFSLLSLTFIAAHAQSSGRSKNIKTYGQSQPSRSIASEPAISSSSSMGSQHFVCTSGNSSFPCDSSGNPVGAANSYIGGGKTRTQLVDECYSNAANSDSSSTESQLKSYCAGWVDQNQRPNNAIDIPKSESADPGDFADAAAQERAQKLAECMDSGNSAGECTKMLDSQAVNSASEESNGTCKNFDGVQCLDDKSAATSETPNRSQAVNQVDLCDSAHKTALDDCDTERQSWMKNIQMAAQGIGPIMESGA